ncbi:unnamed protein product [Calicophoron daubneyi]|uniref:RRM domain-containing protein n=1 Tax=Calicophoron daubneyi TaxID=300641 RepID=A0AAV2TA27_CALDB
MASVVRSEIIQVTNVSPSASSEQLRTLFGHIGVLEEFVLYPGDDKEEPASKVAYIRYHEPINAEVALHLNNTVFLDRALIVLPLAGGRDAIPDEKYANLVRAPPNTAAGVLPRTADWPLDVISMVVGRPGEQVIHTIEPRLSTLAFPLYPPLPATTDGSRIEEIRRTILVTNLDPKTTGDQVLEFFNKHAEVRCVRMAGAEFDRAAYVEFTQQPSIVKAFGLMGATLNGRQIMIQHSNCAIIKPASNLALPDDTSKISSATEAQSKAVDRHKYSNRVRSRSRSHGRRSRSRRRSTSRRHRTRSRDRRRSRSHRSHGKRHSRSRSRGRRRHSRSLSRSRRRSDRGRSRSRTRRKYHRSRSRSGRRRSRSRSRDRRVDRRDRDRDRGSSRSIRERTRDKDRNHRDRDRHRERERSHRRESKNHVRRESVPKPENISNDVTRQETVNRPTVATVPVALVPEGRTSEHDHPVVKRSRNTSSASSNGSRSDSEHDNMVSKQESERRYSVSEPNGMDDPGTASQSSPDHRESKPIIVGVKLASPADMVDSQLLNHAETASPQQSPVESDSSSDAMDTEA